MRDSPTPTYRGCVVTPAYNEADGITNFIHRLADALQPLLSQGVEMTAIVVDDGSRDGTSDVVRTLTGHARVRGLRVELVSLARNFGHQGALIAGMTHAMPHADFVVTMDADGEHPPELISALVEEWRRGSLMVHTVRDTAVQLPMLKRWTSAAYYRLLAQVSGLDISPGMADFKLWDGQLLRDVAPMLHRCGSTRAFAAWLLPEAPKVPFAPRVIPGRVSRFRLSQMLRLGLDGLVRYSDAPLRLSTAIGFLALAFGVVLSVYALWASATGRTVPGWSSTIIAVALLGGLQALSIGILGEYLLRNWFRASLPRYIVNRRRSATCGSKVLLP